MDLRYPHIYLKGQKVPCKTMWLQNPKIKSSQLLPFWQIYSLSPINVRLLYVQCTQGLFFSTLSFLAGTSTFSKHLFRNKSKSFCIFFWPKSHPTTGFLHPFETRRFRILHLAQKGGILCAWLMQGWLPYQTNVFCSCCCVLARHFLSGGIERGLCKRAQIPWKNGGKLQGKK